MPSATGLFHKAVVLRAGELDKLQSMPWKDFYAIAIKAQQALARESGPGGGLMRGFSPVVDGMILPQHSYDPEAARQRRQMCSWSSVRSQTRCP
jgi:hypothetical protein